MCECIIATLFPDIFHKAVPIMCCEPAVQDPEHIPKETGFEQIPLGIHELIDKKGAEARPPCII